MNKGKLFMLPVPIADGVLNDTLPEHTIQTARELKFFLAENAKSARAFLKFCGHPSPIASLSIEEIGHRPDFLQRYEAGSSLHWKETISAL